MGVSESDLQHLVSSAQDSNCYGPTILTYIELVEDRRQQLQHLRPSKMHAHAVALALRECEGRALHSHMLLSRALEPPIRSVGVGIFAVDRLVEGEGAGI